MDVGPVGGIYQHPAPQGGGKFSGNFQVEPAGIEEDALGFFAYFLEALGGKGIAQEGDVQQGEDRGGRVAEAVDELVGDVEGVLRGFDGGDFFVDVDPLGRFGDVIFGDMGVQAEVYQAFGGFEGGFFTFFLSDGVGEQTDIEVVADGFHVAMLFRSEKTAGPADFEVTHGDVEPGAEAGEFADSGEAFGGDFGEGFAAGEGEIGESAASGAADPSAELIELGEAHAVGVFDNEGVAVGDIDAGFDDSGTDEDINFAFEELPPDFGEFMFFHTAMGHGDTGFGDTAMEGGSAEVDGFDHVMDIVDLASAAEFLFNRVTDNAEVIFQHIGLDGMAVLRGLFEGGHIPDAGNRHIQGAGDGCCGEGKHIDSGKHFLKTFLVLDAEALFLIDDG